MYYIYIYIYIYMVEAAEEPELVVRETAVCGSVGRFIIIIIIMIIIIVIVLIIM